MKVVMFVLASIASIVALACSSPSREPARGTPPMTSDPGAVQDQSNTQPSTKPPEQGGAGSAAAPLAEGACLKAVDCESGICEGQGCGSSQVGTCAPKSRACTRDLRAYCGCDGKTFRSSGSCPGARFSAPGECP